VARMVLYSVECQRTGRAVGAMVERNEWTGSKGVSEGGNAKAGGRAGVWQLYLPPRAIRGREGVLAWWTRQMK